MSGLEFAADLEAVIRPDGGTAGVRVAPRFFFKAERLEVTSGWGVVVGEVRVAGSVAAAFEGPIPFPLSVGSVMHRKLVVIPFELPMVGPGEPIEIELANVGPVTAFFRAKLWGRAGQ